MSGGQASNQRGKQLGNWAWGLQGLRSSWLPGSALHAPNFGVMKRIHGSEVGNSREQDRETWERWCWEVGAWGASPWTPPCHP